METVSAGQQGIWVNKPTLLRLVARQGSSWRERNGTTGRALYPPVPCGDEEEGPATQWASMGDA
jgi:hypothetical protein